MPGQEATDIKLNKINAIPLLLQRLQLTGALVTIDAMGTWDEDRRGHPDAGGDYLLALKDNQKRLAEEVALYFDSPEQRARAPLETTDADHGRIEPRIARSRIFSERALVMETGPQVQFAW